MRVPVIALILLAMPMFSCAQEWPMFQHDVAHTGHIDYQSHANISDMTLIWSYKAGGTLQHSPVVVDLTGNKKFLGVIFTSLEGTVYTLWYNGSENWKYDTGEVLVSPPAVGMWKGEKVIAVVTSAGKVILLNTDGKQVWTYESLHDIYSTPVSIGDIEGNGASDIIFGPLVVDNNGNLLGYDKERLASKGFAQGYSLLTDQGRTYDGTIATMPAMGDYDGLSSREIAMITIDNITGETTVSVKDEKGNTINSIRNVDISSPLISADLDNSRRDEIIGCGKDGTIRIINTTSNTVTGIRTATRARCLFVVAADINNHTNLKLVAESTDGTVSLVGQPDPVETTTTTTIPVVHHTDEGSKDSILDHPAILFLLFFIPAIMIVLRKVGIQKKSKYVLGSNIKGRANVWGGDLHGMVGKRTSYDHAELKAEYGGTMTLDQEWNKVMSAEAREEDLKLLTWIMQVVATNPITSEDICKLLKVSNVKLARHAQKLEAMGYLTIDSKSDPSNPTLKATGKKWEL